jgi:hypothetical protein
MSHNIRRSSAAPSSGRGRSFAGPTRHRGFPAWLAALFAFGLATGAATVPGFAATTASAAPRPQVHLPASNRDPIPSLNAARPGAGSLFAVPGPSPWQGLTHLPSFEPGPMLVLTDGTVMVQKLSNGYGTSNWWRLKPDATGSYVNGTWSQVASMPSGYAPTYFGSAVLPDGRVIIEGGEYNGSSGTQAETNKGAIYNPLTNAWTNVNPPTGWTNIGEPPSTILSNGQFMMGSCCTGDVALLNATTLTWTVKTAASTGKADRSGEEGWSLLPSGKVLTVDTTNTPRTEIYTPSTGKWASAGSTPVSLVNGDEVGPQVLRPNGTVFATGATGANAVYNAAHATWSAGPSFPVIGGKQYDIADGPGAVLPDGNVLVMASPGTYQMPAHFFEFNGTMLTQVTDAPGSTGLTSYYGLMLVLPTGQILFNDRIGHLYVYTSTGLSQTSWRPHVTKVATTANVTTTTLAAGKTYVVSGTQLGGLTQASGYGDDYQSATNYPLVRITNTATGHVIYTRTSGMTSMSVAPGVASSAHFTLPAGIALGASTLAVVANGIASPTVSVNVT